MVMSGARTAIAVETTAPRVMARYSNMTGMISSHELPRHARSLTEVILTVLGCFLTVLGNIVAGVRPAFIHVLFPSRSIKMVPFRQLPVTTTTRTEIGTA